MTLANSPTYPVVDEEVTLSITSATGNHATYSLTSVPDGSELETGLVVDASGDATDVFIPDVPGAYGFTAYDYRRFAGIPRFPGDSAGESRDRLLGTQTGTVYVGEVMDLPVVTKFGDGGTFRFTVHNDTVRAAEFVDPTTEVGRVAALDATFITNLAGCVGVAYTSLETLLETHVAELRTEYADHRVATGHHSGADTVNVTDREAPYSNRDAIASLNDLYDKILGHMLAGASGGTWHTNDDTVNTPITGKATTAAQATVTSIDLRFRVYERHRVMGNAGTPPVHTSAGGDTGNSLTAESKLAAAVRTYLDAIVKISSIVTPAGEQVGVLGLSRRFGMTPSR